MGDVKIPIWLKKLPLAPEFHPTDTEFADPIAYISKIEKQASAFGICKVIPPLPKPSKKYVFSNLNKSLAKSPELGCSSSTVSLSSDDKGIDGRPVFTTRHQELGHNLRKGKGQAPIGQSAVHKQVWQSGEVYTLEQFESKSKAFAKMHLGVVKEVTPLVVEALFWKAAGERSIYIEYANDVPGSGFGEPEDLSQYFHRRQRRKINKKCQMDLNHGRHEIDVAINSYDYEKEVSDQSLEVSNEGSVSWRPKVCNTSKDGEGTAGWKLSNSPWNLQVIARSPGSLTRFMADDIPGVTSPMIYIGMLFSWFAWHVEDHELHSLNFLHTGSSKTWYAVPGDYAFDFEEVIRSQGYGGKLDRLAALTLLGEKTNLLSPEVVVASGIPCCRLVQNPGEFVVTFPRAYHVGFSHGFNCGEAANFGTPQWLKVAKEAAIRRAAMNYLPMLSHQQLLYLLTMSFLSRVPRTLLPGERTSRLKDRQKEEREVRVKKEFIEDMLNEHKLLSVLLGKESTICAVLWDPDSLPMPSNVPPSFHISSATDAPCSSVSERGTEICFPETSCAEDVHNEISNLSNVSNRRIISDVQNAVVCMNQVDQTRMHIERSEEFYVDDDDLPCGLHVDSGTLPCVACGILGFPFMSIIQPSERASEKLFPVDCQTIHEGLGVSRSMKPHAPLSVDQTCMKSSSDAQGDFCENKKQKVFSDCGRHVRINEASVYGKDVMLMEACHEKSLTDTFSSSSEDAENIELKGATSSHDQMWAIYSEYAKHLQASKGLQRHSTSKVDKKWNTYSQFLRPRVFCLEHALETEELLRARGGANVLIICHSAYPKIKAHALSVAEEIGATFNCDEVPLVNASKEDLDLINISICDEGHEECGEDWTSRLGVNIHHCVKLRKLSQEKQEHALALGGLFTETVSSSDVSSLKWNSRRSRTSHKVTAQNQSKSCRSADIMKADIPVEKQERSKAAGQNKILQYYRRNRKKVSHGHHRKQQFEEKSRLNGLPHNGIAQNTLCSTSDKQHECPATEETREMISDPENFACSAALENTENDSHKLETFATVENLEILQEVPKAGETSNENRGSDRANAMLLFCSDSTRNDAVELASSLVDFERQREGEEMKGLISDPAKLAGSIASENIEKDNHKLTFPTLENMEVLEVSETEETVEKYEVSVCANDLVSKIERTSNSTVAWESSLVESFKLPYNICMTVETCRSEEVLDSAKSTVLRAVHDSVLQNLEKQMKNQVLEKFFVEGNSEMQHEVRTVGGDSSGGSDNRMSAGLPASSTTFTRNFDAEIEGRIVEETVMEEEACNTLSDTVRRPQCSPTVMRASKTRFCDFADETCHVSQTVSRLESIPKVPETGESMEKNEASDTANAAVPSDTERTGNDTFAWESSPHNICMTSETSRAEEVLDSAKSAVLRAFHDLVLQSLEKQMKNQVFEEVDIEDNSEMQHEARTIGFDSNDGSDPRNSPGLPPVSTSSSRHFYAEVEDRIVEESVLEDKARKIISDTFGRLQSSQTVMGASEAKVYDSADETCQQSNIISRIESSGGERENIEEVNMGGNSVTMVPESTHTAAIDSQPTKRDRHKRKREVEEITEDETNYDGFIRSPCEGLRPRVSRFTACVIGPEVGNSKARRPSNDSFDCKEKKENMKRVHRCDLEGCQMSFETNSELTMHKRNRCTHEGCGKLFSSHRYMMLHQKVHVDERPLNCQWKGCKMSFKWTWARTEHMRVHTGERPYQCKIDGCGLTFRYTSDFSRHRRKTGHGVNANS